MTVLCYSLILIYNQYQTVAEYGVQNLILIVYQYQNVAEYSHLRDLTAREILMPDL
jgi:hypothetical protein